MLLDPITKADILKTARKIELDGIPSGNKWAEYWIVIDGHEYPFKHVVREAYEIATGKKIDETKFTSSPYTRGFIQKKFGFKIYFKVPDNVQFFDTQDLDFFHGVAALPYRKDSKKDVAAGKRIKTSIFGKTNAWVRLLNLDDYQFIVDERWQISGYFKAYSWARIYKPEAKAAKVFFTLGVNSKHRALIIKIDCQRKAYTKEKALTPIQVEAFDRVVSETNASWFQIDFEVIPNYNWERLYETTINFIKYYEPLYLEAVHAVMNAKSERVARGGYLEQVPVPETGLLDLPAKEYSFQGATIDYDAQNRGASELGGCGEELVIRLEQEKLKKLGKFHLAEKVRKARDGEGYDILSFKADESKKYIEVKTTTGTILRPFFMSDNEWEFMKKNAASYSLYRVFNYDRLRDSGKFFEMTGDLDKQVLTRNRQFEVHIKSLNR